MVWSKWKELNSATGDIRGERRGGVSLVELELVDEVSLRSSPSWFCWLVCEVVIVDLDIPGVVHFLPTLPMPMPKDMYGGLVLMTIPGEEERTSRPEPEASPTFIFIILGVISRAPADEAGVVAEGGIEGDEEGIEPVEALLSLSPFVPGADPSPSPFDEELASNEGLALRLLCITGAEGAV